MVVEKINLVIQDLINLVPENYRILIILLIYTILIAIYAFFIWKFYKFLASKEIIQLSLNQYNHSQHPLLEKFFAVILYTVEYLVILPFLVLFWFAVLSLFLLVLSRSTDAQQILLIAAAIIASIRITAYISEDLSKDLAKILPFTILAMFIVGEDFSGIGNIFVKISQIPLLFDNILIFIIFIFGVEFILRIIYSIAQFFYSEESRKEEEEV